MASPLSNLLRPRSNGALVDLTLTGCCYYISLCYDSEYLTCLSSRPTSLSPRSRPASPSSPSLLANMPPVELWKNAFPYEACSFSIPGYAESLRPGRLERTEPGKDRMLGREWDSSAI
jgi:hypothetical protein